MPKSANPIQRNLHGVISRLGVHKTATALRTASRAEDRLGVFRDNRHSFQVVQEPNYDHEGREVWVIRYENELYEFAFLFDSWGSDTDLLVRQVAPKEITVTVYEPCGGQFGIG